MELRHLRYFVAVAEQLSFTRAAAKLRLAQPSLTRQIKNLEEELHVQLFSRGQRGITLTDQGQFFLERTRKLLAQAAANVDDVRRRGSIDHKPSLKIGYSSDLHYELLPAALNELRIIWPEVALHLVDLTVAEQIRAFERDELDLSFVREPKLPSKAKLHCEPIHECEVMAVLPASHPQSGAKTLRLAELAAQPFVALNEASYPGAQHWLRRICRQQGGFTPRIAHQVDRAPTLLTSVGLELGVALLPGGCSKLPHGGVIFRPLVQTVKSRTALVWREPGLSESLRRYAELVRRRFSCPPLPSC